MSEINPSFEDMYPTNQDALYEDFYDALVKVVYGIENLLNNNISTSSVWELACLLQNLESLGMPKTGIFHKRHQKAWKNMLLTTDSVYNLLDFNKEQDAYREKSEEKDLRGIFYIPQEKKYKNSNVFRNWDEQKSFIIVYFRKIFPEYKKLQEMLVKPDRSQVTDVAYTPPRFTEKDGRVFKDKKTKTKKRKISSDLTPKEFEVWTLIHVNKKTQQQAAIEMRCSPQNVSKLLIKAEAKMKARNSRSINLSKAQKLPEDKRGQTNISSYSF